MCQGLGPKKHDEISENTINSYINSFIVRLLD